MVRNFILAVSVTTMNTRSFTALIIMYVTLLYLGYTLGYRRYEGGTNGVRFDLTVELFLTYLLLLLSDFVIDRHHYQTVSNLFIYGTLVMVGATTFILIYHFAKKCIYRRIKRRRYWKRLERDRLAAKEQRRLNRIIRKERRALEAIQEAERLVLEAKLDEERI
jgi:hypothetical protein